MTRTWNEERYGWDVQGPCYACGAPTTYFVDEDGTIRDQQLDLGPQIHELETSHSFELSDGQIVVALEDIKEVLTR